MTTATQARQAREEQQAAEKNAAAALLRTAARFEDQQWCQNATAVDQFGENADPVAETAVQRCILGHLERACHQAGQELLQGVAFQALQGEVPFPQSVAEWNDTPGRQPEEVRQLLRKAARALREEALDIGNLLDQERSDQAEKRELARASRS